MYSGKPCEHSGNIFCYGIYMSWRQPATKLQNHNIYSFCEELGETGSDRMLSLGFKNVNEWRGLTRLKIVQTSGWWGVVLASKSWKFCDNVKIEYPLNVILLSISCSRSELRMVKRIFLKNKLAKIITVQKTEENFKP